MPAVRRTRQACTRRSQVKPCNLGLRHAGAPVFRTGCLGAISALAISYLCLRAFQVASSIPVVKQRVCSKSPFFLRYTLELIITYLIAPSFARGRAGIRVDRLVPGEASEKVVDHVLINVEVTYESPDVLF